MLLVDTNVLVDVLQDDPQWGEWSIGPALSIAGKAYLRYRRRGGSEAQILPDFFIGTHAAVQGWPLRTRDASRFQTFFPTREVIAP